MSANTLFQSFAGGEITPELFGRLDLGKYQTGLALARNWMILPHGPAQTRPGFLWVNECKDSTRKVRVIPFSFSATDTMLLEFGHQYIRFHSSGGTLLEAAKPIVAKYTGLTYEAGVTGHGWVAGDTVWSDVEARFYRIGSVVSVDRIHLQLLDGSETPGLAIPPYGTLARVYTIASPYWDHDLPDIHYTQSADVLTLTHPVYPSRELRRAGVVSWSLVNVSFAPTLAAPAVPTTVIVGAPAGGAATTKDYKITAKSGVEAPPSGWPDGSGLYESVASDAATSIAIDLTVAGNKVAITPSAALPTGCPGFVVYKRNGADYGYIGNAGPTGTVNDTNIAADMTHQPPANSTVEVPAYPLLVASGPLAGAADETQIYQITAVSADGLEESLPSPATAACAVDLTVAGNKVKITPSAALPPRATRYNIYKRLSGLFGYIGQSSAAGTFEDNNITPDMTKTPPEASIQLNEALLAYPSAVAYHEQRRVFAATDADPQGLWMTRPGTEANLTTSIPSQDDDAISIRVKAREQNRIRHLVPLGDLIALTVGGVWRIHSGDAPVITPTTISVKQQGGVGASNVQPALSSGSVLYVQAKGSRIRELAFDNDKGGYVATDMSIMSSHLVDRHTILDIAYTHAPLSALWATRSDGVLLCMTYVPEHQVFAWHEHVTDGSFESVAVVAEGNEDVLYAVVARLINGRTVRNIERLSTRLFPTKTEAFCVDCGLTYRGAATLGMRNLHHLEGKTVSILADGAVKAQQVVVNGGITLDHPASVMHVGLQYVCDLVTLPISMMGQRIGAAGVGTTKNVSSVFVRTLEASGLRVGPSFTKLTDIPARATTDDYGQPPHLRTELRKVGITGSWSQDGAVCFRQDQPLPATILSIALDAATGG